MTDYSQQQQLDRIQRELARQSLLLEQLLDGLTRLQPQAPATAAAAPAPKPNLVRRVGRWLRGA